MHRTAAHNDVVAHSDVAGDHVSDHVEIYEVGPRDGLQNEAFQVPTEDKIALVDALSQVGFAHIEATSFVSPKWVPQLADAAAVMDGIQRRDGVRYAVLTPNMKGFDAAAAAGADEVAIFGAASEGFSQKNINCSIAESIDRFGPVAAAANAAGISLRGYVSCVIACPYDGVTDPAMVADVTARMLNIGCREVSLGDTIGAGSPDDVRRLLDVVCGRFDAGMLAGHFHDTGGVAVQNVMAALDYGLRVFDTAIGGLGGCPYAPGARGNVDSRSVHDALTAAGWQTGLDPAALDRAGQMMQHIASNSANISDSVKSATGDGRDADD